MFPKKDLSRPFSIKAGAEAYCLFSVVVLPLIISWMVYYLYHPQTNVSVPLLFFWVTLTAYLIWLNSFKITLMDDCFVYQSFFCFGRTFFFKNIHGLASIVGKIGLASFSRMKIYESLNPTPSDLNISYFSQNDLTLLVQLAQDKNPQIELNAPTLYLARGEFDFVKYFGLKGLLQISLWVLWGILLRSLFVVLA